MNLKIVLVLLCAFFFLCPVTSAGPLEDLIGYRYIESPDDLQYSGHYTPDTVNYSVNRFSLSVFSCDFLDGWIDIVGYENMICVDGEYYIDSIEPIVKHDVWCVPMPWDFYWDEIVKLDESTSTVSNITTTEVEYRLLWHITSSSASGGVDKDYFYDFATFSDHETAPKIFPGIDCINTSIEVVIYNNTIKPKTTIKLLNVPDNVMSIKYKYDDEIIIHHLGTGTQEKTDKGCPYMNITWVDRWEDKGDLSQFNGHVIIPDMNFSSDNLSITLHGPYDSTEIINTTIYESKWHSPGDTFSPLLIVFLLVVGIFVVGSYIQLRRLKCR